MAEKKTPAQRKAAVEAALVRINRKNNSRAAMNKRKKKDAFWRKAQDGE